MNMIARFLLSACLIILLVLAFSTSSRAQFTQRFMNVTNLLTNTASSYLTVRLSDGSGFLDFATDATQGATVPSGGPQSMLEGSSSLATATPVAAGQSARARGDLLGRTIGLIGCNRESRVRGRAVITGGASTSLLSSISGVIYEIYAVEITNSSATDVTVDLRDGTAGSVLWTVSAPAGAGNNRVFTVPLTFSATTAVAAHPSASASSITVSVLGCAVK
jgi:hypothetical protein